EERFRHAPAHDDHAHDDHAHDDHAHDAHGDDHAHHGPVEPHESPWVVTLPLVLLAIPSIAIGYLTVGPMLFGDFFAGAIHVAPEHDVIRQLGEELFHGPMAFGLHFWASPAFWLAFAGFALATWLYLVKPGSSAWF